MRKHSFLLRILGAMLIVAMVGLVLVNTEVALAANPTGQVLDPNKTIVIPPGGGGFFQVEIFNADWEKFLYLSNLGYGPPLVAGINCNNLDPGDDQLPPRRGRVIKVGFTVAANVAPERYPIDLHIDWQLGFMGETKGVLTLDGLDGPAIIVAWAAGQVLDPNKTIVIPPGGEGFFQVQITNLNKDNQLILANPSYGPPVAGINSVMWMPVVILPGDQEVIEFGFTVAANVKPGTYPVDLHMDWMSGGDGGVVTPDPVIIVSGKVPVFPNIYIGIAAALGAGIVAYFLRRRLVHQEYHTENIKG